MDQRFFVFGCLAAALGVALGAFGAHALRDRLGPQMIAIFETGVRYQLIHALALLAVGIVRAGRPESAALAASGWLFVAGIVLFSGSLYLLTLTGPRWLGAATPVGGVSFILGWVFLALGVMRSGQ